MSEEETITIEVNKHELRHQLAKLVLGTAVGFIATKMAENVYDSMTNRRNNKTAEVQQ